MVMWTTILIFCACNRMYNIIVSICVNSIRPAAKTLFLVISHVLGGGGGGGYYY